MQLISQDECRCATVLTAGFRCDDFQRRTARIDDFLCRIVRIIDFELRENLGLRLHNSERFLKADAGLLPIACRKDGFAVHHLLRSDGVQQCQRSGERSLAIATG